MAPAEAGLIGLLALTYLGGSGTDDCDAIAAGPGGSVFLACHSDSKDFPAGTKGRGDFDAVALKLREGLSATDFAARFGGRGWDAAFGIAVNAAGEAHLVGITESPDFPTTAGAFQRRFGGGSQDAFVVKLDAKGSVLYATLLGGAGDDFALAVALDAAGFAYVVGGTGSADFPTTPSAWRQQAGGGSDAFVTKLAPDGTVVFSSYLGGSGSETAHGVAVSGDGVYVAGGTDSRDFPGAGTLPLRAGAGSDAFLAKLDPAGTRLLLAGAFGGQGSDTARAVAIDPAGSVYLAGLTASPDFPVTRGAAQATAGGGDDAFVVKVEGTALAYSTYLGGTGADAAYALAVTPSGSAWLGGWTESRDLPTKGPLEARHRGDRDGLLAGFDPRGALAFATYLGGRGADLLEGIAIGADGSVLAAGLTGSPDLRVVGPLPARFRGGPKEVPYDVLLARITPPRSDRP